MCPSPNVDVHRSLSRRFFLQIWQAEVILKSLPLDIEFWEFLTIAGRFCWTEGVGRGWIQWMKCQDWNSHIVSTHTRHYLFFWLEFESPARGPSNKNKLPSFMSNFNYLRVSLMILRREIIHALCNFWVSFLLGFIIRQVSSSRGKFRYFVFGSQDILMKTILGSC